MTGSRSRGVFLLTAAAVLAVDRISKTVVTGAMHLHQSVDVAGDWVRLTYIHNRGAAFGLFPGSRWFLIAVSVLAAAIVVRAAWRGGRPRIMVPLGLILGGAVGNLIDRVRRGEVVDFLDVGLGAHRWPVFNAADSAVTIGVAWLAVAVLFGRSDREESTVGGRDAHLAAPGDDG
jgi:signal peptidase II